MPTDKEILYSMLDREIDNLLGYNLYDLFPEIKNNL